MADPSPTASVLQGRVTNDPIFERSQPSWIPTNNYDPDPRDNVNQCLVAGVRATRAVANAAESVLLYTGIVTVVSRVNPAAGARLTQVLLTQGVRDLVHNFPKRNIDRLQLAATVLLGARMARAASEEVRLPEQPGEALGRRLDLRVSQSLKPENFKNTYSANDLRAIVDKGNQLGLSGKVVEDMAFAGSRVTKPVPAAELLKQMENWATEVSPRGYPYRFKSAAEFKQFSQDLKAELQKAGVPDGDVRIQGSSLRKPLAGDVDVGVFVDEATFDAGLVKRFSNRLTRKGEAGTSEPIDLSKMSHDQLMGLAREIKNDVRGFNSQADTFQKAMQERMYNSKSDINKPLKAARRALAEKYPDVNLETIGMTTRSSSFNLSPDLPIR